MKKLKNILGLATLLLASVSFGQIQKKVLFIGNSYTSANDLPSLVKSIAIADGNNVIYDTYIPGGSQLSQHATNPVTLGKITADNWDYVVLQEQSQKPSFPDAQVQSDVYPYAEVLVDSIYSNNECSIPLFYGTWGRQVGDPQWEGINTFEKMNDRLFKAYSHMAEAAEGMLSPVGIGFGHIKQDPNAVVSFNALYTVDGSHPTIKGSYLAACIFNNMIFEGWSSGNSFLPAGLTANEAEYLQAVADHVIYEVDSVQVDFRPYLEDNDFTTTVVGGQVTFASSIFGGDFTSWDFGDGQTSTQENVTHNYTNSGVYEVIMYSSAHCQTDSTKKNITISTLDLSHEALISFNVYPNPSKGKISIDVQGDEDYFIYSLLGKEIYSGKVKELILPSGVYIVRYRNESRKITVL